MAKRWCIWCETGETQREGYYWIHINCAMKLIDIKEDLKIIRILLEGKNYGKRIGDGSIECVKEFIEDINAQEKRWEGTIKMLKEQEAEGVN